MKRVIAEVVQRFASRIPDLEWNVIQCSSSVVHLNLRRWSTTARHKRHYDDCAGLPRRVPTFFVPVSISPEQATSAFVAHHNAHLLSPRNVVDASSDHAVKLAYFPFFVFEATFDVQYCASVGHRPPGSSQIVWTRSSAQQLSNITLEATNPVGQVYAAFHDRRDLADGLKPVISESLGAYERLHSDAQLHDLLNAQKHAVGRVEVQAREMRQAIAWELALRGVRHWQEREAAQQLKEAYQAHAVRDVEMSLQVHGRSARVVYLPGYVFNYSYGKIQVGNIDIVRQWHSALAPAAGTAGRVVAERHVSARKAQAAAATGVVSGSAAYHALTAPVLDWSWIVSVDTAFYTFLAASVAGLLARGFTSFMRDRHAGEVDDKITNNQLRYMQKSGMTAMSMEDSMDAWLRNDAEWTRWEEAEKWDWNHHKRKQAAERIFREHKSRRLQNLQAARRMEAEELRREQDAQRAAFREARFGRSERQNLYAGGINAGGRLDFKGYYKLLGLDANKAKEIKKADIQKAFRDGAFKNHPDRVQHLGDDEQAAAHKRFRDLQDAYDILKDPEKRKMYDAGAG